MVWICRTEFDDGDCDVEVLDEAPTDDFREGIRESFDERFEVYSDTGEVLGHKRLVWAEIRCGNVNGGDSSLDWSFNGEVEFISDRYGKR